MVLDSESSYIIQYYGIGGNLVISFSIMVLDSQSSYIIQYYGIGQWI